MIKFINKGGEDISEYLDDKLGSGTSNYGYMSKFIKKIPNNVTVSGTDLGYCFAYCSNITELPYFDTSNVTSIAVMCKNCSNLVTVPTYNTGKVTNFSNMFQSCPSLSSESLNNILAMCIGATSYTNTKTLAKLGLTEAQATICEGLSNYQDFLTAGWTTGY